LIRIAMITMLLACLAVLAGCGGSTFAVYEDGRATINEDWHAGSSWDPFAPALRITDVHTATANTVGRKIGTWEVVALDALNQPDAALLKSLRLEASAGVLRISAGQDTQFAGLYVRYNATSEHVAVVDCTAEGRLALAAEFEPGLYSIGVVALGTVIPAGELLAEVRFASGAALLTRKPSISQATRNAVSDLTAVDNGDETVTVNWSERHTGDYDLNSEVSVADLVPIAQNYLEIVEVDNANYAVLEVIDGDANTEINAADLVPIAQNLGSMIEGYNIYRTALANATEVPDPAAAARWTKLENDANPSGPSIPRDLPAGQNFRLRYTFHDECGPGDFGWMVRAVGTGASSQTEGPVCPAATLTVDSTAPPAAALSLAIMAPYSSLLNLNDEFYVSVRVDNITGLASANVRLEYDSSLLQFVDGVGEYDTNTNLLSNYLFLAVDDVGAAAAPYKLLGFNITQKQGTAAVTGSGAVGYLHFRAIGSGVNTSAIRFPQATTYLLLWGEQYGVPVATPALGGALTINIG
jgi:hypothetical protein